MSIPPNQQRSDLRQDDATDEQHPPTPSEFIVLIRDWLDRRKNAPREKSKAADWAIAGLTVLIAIAAFWSAFIFQGQLEEARRLTEISERPWLSVEISPLSGISWTKGAAPASGLNGSPFMKLKVSIKNVGKSIAKDVQIDAKMIPTGADFLQTPEAAENQRKLCDNPDPQQIMKFDVFPVEQPTEREKTIGILPREIEPRLTTSSGNVNRKFVGLYVVGCVSYHYSFESKLRQTFFAYGLIGPPILSQNGDLLILSNGKPIMGGAEVGVDIAKDKIGMEQEIFARNDAY